jgi:hypothetical protein
MTEKLAILMKFENPFQAETVRIGLIEQGVKAFIENSESTRAMHYVGTALGGVKVLVPSGELSRAKELLHSMINEAGVEFSAPWICGACKEEVDAGFEVCWSCGAERNADSAPSAPPILRIDDTAPDAE